MGSPNIPASASPVTQTRIDPETERRNRERRRRMMSYQGRQSMLQTGARGLTSPARTAPKQLLGE